MKTWNNDKRFMNIEEAAAAATTTIIIIRRTTTTSNTCDHFRFFLLECSKENYLLS